MENKSNKQTRAVRDYKKIKYQRKGNSIKRKQDKQYQKRKRIQAEDKKKRRFV